MARYTWPKKLPYLLTSTKYLTLLSLATCIMISTYVFTLGLSMSVHHFHLEHETNREKMYVTRGISSQWNVATLINLGSIFYRHREEKMARNTVGPLKGEEEG